MAARYPSNLSSRQICTWTGTANMISDRSPGTTRRSMSQICSTEIRGAISRATFPECNWQSIFPRFGSGGFHPSSPLSSGSHVWVAASLLPLPSLQSGVFFPLPRPQAISSDINNRVPRRGLQRRVHAAVLLSCEDMPNNPNSHLFSQDRGGYNASDIYEQLHPILRVGNEANAIILRSRGN